jgi:hypothetical protein
LSYDSDDPLIHTESGGRENNPAAPQGEWQGGGRLKQLFSSGMTSYTATPISGFLIVVKIGYA